MNKKKQFTTLFTLVMMLLVLSIGGYQVIKANQNTNTVGEVGFEKNSDYYSIRSNASDYQKEIYQALIEAVETKDHEKMAALTAQNFIADFFTWTNKVRLNDVGGLQFVYKDVQANVSHAAQDGIYNDMYTYLSEGKIENSLQVKSSQVTLKTSKFKMDDVLVDAYVAEVTWDYEESDVLNQVLYQSKAFVTMVQDVDGLYSIVEVNENEK